MQMSKQVRRRVQRYRPHITLTAYGFVAAAAYLCAYLLRFEFDVPAAYRALALQTLPLIILTRITFDRLLRLTTSRWRFVGTQDVVRLMTATTLGTIVFFAVARLLPFAPRVPNSIVVIEWLLTVQVIAGTWLSYRLGFEQIRHHRSRSHGSARRVLIIGAGEAGYMLAREMMRLPTGYWPIGFVDDDQDKWGTSLHGVYVFGGSRELLKIAASERAEEIILAVPSADPAELRRLVEQCELTSLPFKVLPGIAEVLAGDAHPRQLRELRIEDLLGREPVTLELPELAADIQGRCVLVTGAAGSIGSELARQVALHQPRALVLLDQAETELFYLELDIRELHPQLNIAAVVGDITNIATIERIFRTYRPEQVYHAAAYKHVPMMQVNAPEALRNNVIGTWRVAAAAGRHRADKFVLVSSDKAVRPVSVMGVTKRLAEALVLELQDQFPATAYGAVRFGNVLGSNGSVIPLFRRQLAAGKPLTVTHPEATRYFMTIPEAVQLILQASLLPGFRGKIAMLDMGQPVRILDLARNLVRIAAKPGVRPQIVFTGLRAGERLHEELVAPDEETIDTEIPKVSLLVSGHRPPILRDMLPLWERMLDTVVDDQSFASMLAVITDQSVNGNGMHVVDPVRDGRGIIVDVQLDATTEAGPARVDSLS